MAQVIHWREVVSPGEAFHAARATNTHRNPVPYHGHDFGEVFWIDAGRAVHRVNGAEQPLHPGSFVLIRRQDCHAIEPRPGEILQLTNIAFPQETAEFLRQRYFASPSAPFWNSNRLPFSPQLESGQAALFNRWADTLAQAPRERLHIERFLLDVLSELSPRQGDSLPEEAPDWLLHACREMQKPENCARGVEAFFRLAARSREHVARSSRQFLEMTPTDYVNRTRMNYAARQLEMSNLSILEVALNCGIQNLSHFYEIFRRQFRTTPRAYRLANSRLVSRRVKS